MVRGTFIVTAFGAGGEIVALEPRTDLRNHSPTGFAWGYIGSGPAQLGASWRLTEAELLTHVRRLEEEADRKE